MNFVAQWLPSFCPWVATLVTRTSSPKSICSHCLPSLVFAHQAPYPLLLPCKFNLALAGAYLAWWLEDAENAASGTWPFSKPRGREQRYTKLKESHTVNFIFWEEITRRWEVSFVASPAARSFSATFAQRVRRKTTAPFRALYIKPQWAQI